MVRSRWRELLRRDSDCSFAGEQLEKFARLLNIANAATAYEYMKEGDTDGLTGWKKFEELPADEIVAEKCAAAKRRKEITALKKRLKSLGLLLAEVVGRGNWARASAADDGFAVAWSLRIGVAAKPRFDLFTRPWKEPRAVPLDLSPQVNQTANNRSGSCLAAALGRRVVVWSMPDGRVLRDVPESDWAICVALSDDGALLAHSSRKEVVVTEVRTGLRLTTFPQEGARKLAFHPSGRFLLGTFESFPLGMAVLDSQATGEWRHLDVGDQKMVNMSPIIKRFQTVDPAELEKKHRAMLESAIERVESQWLAEAPGSKMSETVRDRVRQEIKAKLERIRDAIAKLRSRPPVVRCATERPMCMWFTSDGQWFCCGTDAGLRVYSWAAVAATTDDRMPSPTWRHDLSEVQPSGIPNGYIYAITQETGGPGVLFGGLMGHLFRLDLQSGGVKRLLVMPEEASILELVMSRDGQALGVISNPNLPDRQKRRNEERTIWSIWSYPKLLERADENP